MKKLSKRLLSVLLAALLVMTSVPMFAFNAAAADTAALDQAMNAYEQKMDGNFYTNMKAAYDAYMAAAEVKANESASASDIASAAAALTNATNNMGEFSGYAANGTIAYGTSLPTNGAGILWADGSGDTAYDQSQGGKSESSTLGITYGGYYWFYYPKNTVLLYDGRTTPMLPVMMGALDKDANYDLHPRYLALSSNDFILADDWRGYNDNFVWPTTTSTTISHSFANPQSMDEAFTMDNTSTVRSFRNYLSYTNVPTVTLTNITSMDFVESHWMNVVGTTQSSENKNLHVSAPIHVINYKKLLDKLGQVGAQYSTALDNVSDYKEDGGLGDLLEAIDYASTDPNNFFAGSNNYTGCANWIDAAVAGFDGITVTMDASAAASEQGAKNALSAFESKMQQGKWKNVLPVYQKYVYLKAMIDAEKYGGNTYDKDDIAVATTSLVEAMEALEAFTPYQANGTVTMQDDTTAITDSRYVSGVIGSNKASTATIGYSSINGSGSEPGGVYAFVNAPTTIVALYDGTTPIRIPVMTAWHNNKGTTVGTGNRRMMNAVYPIVYNDGNYTPADNADFGLTQVWKGHTNDTWNSNMVSTPNNVSFKWSSAQNPSTTYTGTLAGYNQSTYNAGNTYQEYSTWQGQNGWGTTQGVFAYWNFMEYKGGASGFTNGIKTVKVNFWGMSKWPKAEIDTEGRHWFGTASSPVTTVTIIDYKSIIDTFNANWDTQMAKLTADENTKYDEGGFAAVFAACDDFTGDNTIASVTAANAATTVNNLNSKAAAIGTATAAVNSTGYQAIRDKLDWYPTAEKYVQGMADPTYWTAESWQALLDAISAARTIMVNLPTNNVYYYVDPTAAQNAANAIQTAYDNLVVGGVLVDPAVTAYNTFINALADYTYTATSLNAAKAYYDSVTTEFYKGTIGTRVPIENETAINAEATAFTNATNALVTEEFDKSAYDGYLEAAHRGVNDPDAYDINKLHQDVETLENAALENVTIGTRSIIGLKDNAQTAVDTAWSAVQSDFNTKMQYTVTVVDVDGNEITGVGEGTYTYGTEITINAGTGDYTYDFVSNTGNTDGAHKVKNIGTVDSYTFTVQGNTTITVGAPTANKPIKVTYRAVLAGDHGTSFTIGTDYVASADDIDVNAVKAPSYAFYRLDSKTKGEVVNNEVTVTLNYSLANGAQQFTIWNDEEEETYYYYFNELVTVTLSDAPAIAVTTSQEKYDLWWEEADTGEFTPGICEIVAFGDTYTFRVRENLWTIWLDEYDAYADSYKFQNDETQQRSKVYVRSQANISGQTLVTYNSIALPDGYEIVEAGVLAQYNNNGDELIPRVLNFNEVGQDQGNDKVRRLKATKIFAEEDNRYTINLNLKQSGAKVKYRAYVNYTDDEGNAHTVMADESDVITIG